MSASNALPFTSKSLDSLTSHQDGFRNQWFAESNTFNGPIRLVVAFTVLPYNETDKVEIAAQRPNQPL